MRVIGAVFFDLDGTLVDSDAARDAALAAMVSDAGARELWRELEDRHFNAYLTGRISHEEQRRRRVRDLHAVLGRPAPAGWFSDYLVQYERAWVPFPDARPVLARLKPRVGVLSNGRIDQQRAKLAATGLLGYVEMLLTSDELGVTKPAPEAFLAACQAAELPPHQVMYIGDRLDVDARPAIAAGLHGVWLNRTSAEQTQDIDTITSLHQLHRLLYEGGEGASRSTSRAGH